MVRGSGVVLDAQSTPFHDVPITRATTSVVERHLAERRPTGAGLDIGAMLLEDELRVSLDASGFDRHTFFCGQSGSGKTYALGTVLERLILDTDLRIVVLDPNSDFVRLGEVREGADPAVADRYREAAEGLVVRRSAATGSERLHVRFTDCDAEEQAAVLRLDPIADREEYGALVDLLDGGLEAAPSSVGDLASRLLEAPDPATRALGARIRNLGLHRWPIWSVGDTGSVQDLVQPGGPRVAIVDLGSLQTPGEKAIAAESVLAALWRRRSVREPILIVIDEAHNVCPREPDDPVTALASEHAARIAAEGRKFGLYLLVSTQRPQRVNELVVSQCDNLVLMRMISAARPRARPRAPRGRPGPAGRARGGVSGRRVARRREDRLPPHVRPLRPARVRGGRRRRAHLVGSAGAGLSQPTSRRAAASISSSETRTSRAASPSGTNESLLATRATFPAKPASTSSAMTPSETPPVRRVSSTTSTWPVRFASRSDVLDGKRREPAEVDDARADPLLLGEPVRDPCRQVQPVRPRHDRQVGPVADRARRADRDVLVRERRRPRLVAVLDRVARVVQRDRLEEDADAPVHERRLGARHEHGGGIVGPRRRRDDDAGDVAQHADRVVVVEVPSEAPLVAVARDPDHHPVPVRALGEELERRRLAAKLVLGVVEVREVLDLGNREEPADRRPEREAEDRGLVEQRVEDPPGAEPAHAARASRRRRRPSPRCPRRRRERSGAARAPPRDRR